MFPLWCNDDAEWSVWVSCVLCLLDFCKMVLKGIQNSFQMNCNVSYCSFSLLNDLERSQFWTAYKQVVLKWVNLTVKHNGLERSQFLMVSPYNPVMVLKEANFVGMYNGLERSQFYHVGSGVEMSQFALIYKISPNGLERSQCMVLKACLALALADLSSLYGARGEVSFNSGESLCVSLLSMSWNLTKAGSDWCLFLPSCEESSELGSTDDCLDRNDVGVNMMVI